MEQDREAMRRGGGRYVRVLRTFGSDRSGATAVEYALFAVILGIGLLVVLTQVADENTAVYTKIKDAYRSATQGG